MLTSSLSEVCLKVSMLLSIKSPSAPWHTSPLVPVSVSAAFIDSPPPHNSINQFNFPVGSGLFPSSNAWWNLPTLHIREQSPQIADRGSHQRRGGRSRGRKGGGAGGERRRGKEGREERSRSSLLSFILCGKAWPLLFLRCFWWFGLPGAEVIPSGGWRCCFDLLTSPSYFRRSFVCPPSSPPTQLPRRSFPAFLTHFERRSVNKDRLIDRSIDRSIGWQNRQLQGCVVSSLREQGIYFIHYFLDFFPRFADSCQCWSPSNLAK